MGRLYWKRTLVSSVAWAGLALGQQPLSSSPQADLARPAAKTMKTLTVQEQGKSLKCRIVEAWRLPTGARAYQVQVIDSGEMLTLVQEGQATPVSTLSSGQKLQALNTRIYHWADTKSPHPDAPRPPMALQPTPAPVQLVGHPSPAPHTAPPVAASTAQLMSLPGENGKQFSVKVLKTWKTAQGTVAHHVQSVDTGDMLTVEDGVTGRGPDGKVVNNVMHIYRWTPDKTPPPNAPVPPGGYGVTATAAAPAPLPLKPVAAGSSTPALTQGMKTGTSSSQPLLPEPEKKQVAILNTPTDSTNNSRPLAKILDKGKDQPTPPGVPALPPPPPPPPMDTTGFEVPGARSAATPPAPKAIEPVLPLPVPTPTATTSTLPTPKSTDTAKPTTTITNSASSGKGAVVGAQAVPLPSTKSTPSTMTPWPAPVDASKSGDTKTTTTVSKPTDVKPSTTTTASKPTDVKTTTASQTTTVAKSEAKPDSSPKLGDKIKGLFGSDKDNSNSQTTTETKPNEWRSSWGKTDDHKTGKSSDERPLPHSTASAKDPLQPGEQVKKTTVENKLQNFGKTAEKEVARIDSSKAGTATGKSVELPKDAAAGTVPGAAAANAPRLPLGSGSVLAAGSPPGQVQYVPVPMIQMPGANQAPIVPAGPPPQPPQPIPQRPMVPSGNAFTAPQPAAPAGVSYNAFTPTPGMMPPAQYAGQGQYPNQGQYPGQGQYPAQGQYVAQGQRPMPQGMMPTANPAAAQGMPTHSQVSYMDRRPAPASNTPLPTTNAPTPAGSQQLHEMLTTLKDSLYPSQREWAADSLSKMDWKTHPEIVLALLTAAREDPAPMVRAACVRCLARMNVSTAPVVSALQSLKSDSDARVRVEAEKACGMLGTGQGVQPVGYQMPGK